MREIIFILENVKYHYLRKIQNNLRDHSRIRMVLYNQYHEDIKALEMPA